MTKTVLLLFVKSDEQESKKVKDELQVRLGTPANVNTVKDLVADDSDLKKGLAQSHCVVLVSSKQSSEFIKQGTQEKEDGFVLFDSNLIQEHLKKKDFQEKLIVIQFGNAVSTTNLPDGYDKKVFLVGDNFAAAIDEIESAVKGVISTTKVKDEKEKKKKGGCAIH